MTLNMAAIAAQVTRQQRERSKSIHERNWKNVETSKSLYSLRPFDTRFDPSVHNKFVRNKIMNKEDAFLYNCIEKFLIEKKNEQMMVKTTRMEKVVDVLIIGIILKHLI